MPEIELANTGDLLSFDHLAVLAAIDERRSIRRYQDRPVPEELIRRIVQAGGSAPSAHNRQPWRFAILIDPAAKHLLAEAMGSHLQADLQRDGVAAEVISRDVMRSYERITSAPVVVIICLSMSDMDVYNDPVRDHNEFLMTVQSTAMAGQNMLLAAHALGLGACWMCAPLFSPEIVRETLKLETDWKPQGMITLGYPAQRRERVRETIETRVVWR